MALGGLVGIMGAIVSVAALSVLLSSSNTASIIKNFFDGFASSIKASMGN